MYLYSWQHIFPLPPVGKQKSVYEFQASFLKWRPSTALPSPRSTKTLEQTRKLFFWHLLVNRLFQPEARGTNLTQCIKQMYQIYLQLLIDFNKMAHIHDFDMLEASGEKEAANFKMARRFSGQTFFSVSPSSTKA